MALYAVAWVLVRRAGLKTWREKLTLFAPVVLYFGFVLVGVLLD